MTLSELEEMAARVQQLSDLALAVLVCLVADQHCIVSGASSQLPAIAQELRQTALKTFGLTCVTLSCNEKTTLEDFCNTVVSDPQPSESDLDNRQTAQVVIAQSLDRASLDVQIQALELIRSRRIFSRRAVHTAPKRFLVVALVSSTPRPRQNWSDHLNDRLFISHHHVADQEPAPSISSKPSQSSFGSVVHHRDTPQPVIPDHILTMLQERVPHVNTTAELRRHMHNIVTFLRLHRGVAGGISAVSSRHLGLLARVLALLHGLNYVTPPLTALAARKVLPHRIHLATASNERSMQWGSERAAVNEALVSLTPEEIVEEVLANVPSPL